MSHKNNHENHSCECCGKDHCSCGQGSSCSAESHHHNDDHKHFAEELLELADCAWMEVLKEKIKEQVKVTNGKHLDELAKLVSDTNNERWKSKLSSSKHCQEFKSKLDNFFDQK